MSYYPLPGEQGQSEEYPDENSARSTPREPSYPQWQQQQQQQQESQHPQVFDHLHSQQAPEQPLSFPPPPQHSMYLEDPQHSVPSQPPVRGTHDLTPIRLLPVAPGPPGRSPPVEIKPVMLQVEPTVRSTARPHLRQYNPYPRPTSASGSMTAVHRREIEALHHVRFPSQTNPPHVHPGSAMHSPGPARQTFASPTSVYAPQQGSSSSFVSTSPLAAPPEGTFAPFVPAAPAGDERRYIIRADTHYNPETRVLTALLELPGMKKRDLTITLATTLFNRCRQVTVNGQSRAPFPAAAAAQWHRERRYGRFTRAFPVPEDTKVDDIDAAMEDGVLVL
ncbi:hypothetical protein C8R44DRAFT_676355, partial [Mycena epipterygia]